MSISKTVNQVLFTPIPGLSDIPGISHLTGVASLRRMQKQGRKDLASHRIQQELRQIELDYLIMQDADLRNEQDRKLQTSLFGKPIYDPVTDHYAVCQRPELAPAFEEFSHLEALKREIRINLRPRMEHALENALAMLDQCGGTITADMEKELDALNVMRLSAMTQRGAMLDMRKHAYQLVESFLRGQTGLLPSQSGRTIDPLLAGIGERQRTEELLSGSGDKDLARLIDAKRGELATLQKAGDELKLKIDKGLGEQKKHMRKRAILGTLAIAATTLTGLGMREGAALHRREQPYESRIEAYRDLDIDPQKQSFPFFKKPFRNYFSQATPQAIKAHNVEMDVRPEHGHATAILMDIAHESASGNPNAHTDLGRVTLHARTGRSFGVPALEQSYLVERRLRDAERMLHSTTEHHVFNTSTTQDMPFTVGTSGAARERAFMLGITCPVTVPTGNEMGAPDEVVDRFSQHLGELSHYPRYALQVGQSEYMMAVKGWPDAYTVSSHNHPFPYALFSMPTTKDDDYLSSLAPDGELTGSSMACAGLGGYLAGIKSHFPQLSWDNILYAVAVGAERNFLVPQPSVANAHNAVTYSSTAGFGLPDVDGTMKVLHHMLARRAQNEHFVDNPQYIFMDATRSGPAKRMHQITLPSDKEVLKITFDVLSAQPKADATLNIRDEAGNTKTIKLTEKSRLNRFTDWGFIGTRGGTLTITASEPIKLGYLAHINEIGAISMGIRSLNTLEDIEALSKHVNNRDIERLPIAMPRAPTAYEKSHGVAR